MVSYRRNSWYLGYLGMSTSSSSDIQTIFEIYVLDVCFISWSDFSSDAPALGLRRPMRRHDRPHNRLVETRFFKPGFIMFTWCKWYGPYRIIHMIWNYLIFDLLYENNWNECTRCVPGFKIFWYVKYNPSHLPSCRLVALCWFFRHSFQFFEFKLER